MDPLSILAAVSAASRAALSLSTTLFGFVQATRNVDQSVRGLYDEVTGLNTVLDAIGHSIQVLSMGKGKQPEDARLWQSVVTSLDHCCETVRRMHETIKSLQSPRTNVLDKAIRALKLNWNEDQIKTLDLRSKPTTRHYSLHYRHLASTTPQLVTDNLVPRIEILTDMVKQLSQRHVSSAPHIYESQIDNSVSTEQSDITNLMVSAQSVLSEAISVVAKSEEALLIALLITVTQGNYPSKPLQANIERRDVVENWIPTVAFRSNTSDLDSSSIATRTQMTPTQSSYETPSLASGYPKSVMEDDYSDDDDDDDFEYEFLQSFFDRGFSYYKERKWEDAERFLRRGIDTSMKLPPDKLRHKNIMLDEAQFKFAICVFYQCKFEDAEVALLPLRTARPTTNEMKEVTLRRILAIYAFAILCFRKNQLNEARRHSRKALSMKRRHFDKDM